MNVSGKELIAIGRLGRAKGLNGELYLDLFNPDSELLLDLASLEVGFENQEKVSMAIESAHSASNRWIIAFDNVLTRDDAERLTNQFVYVSKEILPELPEGSYYHCDILGFEVFNTSDKKLGVLKQILPTVSNEIYVVEGEEELYLPNIPGVVRQVLLDEKKMIVSPPEYVDAV